MLEGKSLLVGQGRETVWYWKTLFRETDFMPVTYRWEEVAPNADRGVWFSLGKLANG